MKLLELVLASLFLLHRNSAATPAAADASCPPVEDFTAEYHDDAVCDKRSQNRFHDGLNRGQQSQGIQENGIYHVPDRTTLHCPQQVEDLFLHDNGDTTYNYGFSTMWIVHNQATSPVVISWIDRQTKDSHHHHGYREVSAVDGITSPPHKDPNAILQPNEWKALHTYDGHVFVVRRLLPDMSSGRVLLQHRVGLIPIRNAFGHALEEWCDPNDPDPEPLVEEDKNHPMQRALPFRRSLRPPLRPCNTLDIGFRNLVGCPLHVYYSGVYNMTGRPRQPDEACSFTAKSCHEQFKFHLGTNPYSQDFVWGWDSQTKFEGTYVGHNFVFRLIAHDDIVVDSVTIEATYVSDCDEANQEDHLVNISRSEARIPHEPLSHLRGGGDDIVTLATEYDDEEF